MHADTPAMVFNNLIRNGYVIFGRQTHSSKVLFNHSGGSKPSIEHHADNSKDGELQSQVEFFRAMHSSTKKGWVNEKARSTYGQNGSLEENTMLLFQWDFLN